MHCLPVDRSMDQGPGRIPIVQDGADEVQEDDDRDPDVPSALAAEEEAGVEYFVGGDTDAGKALGAEEGSDAESLPPEPGTGPIHCPGGSDDLHQHIAPGTPSTLPGGDVVMGGGDAVGGGGGPGGEGGGEGQGGGEPARESSGGGGAEPGGEGGMGGPEECS